MWRKRFLLGLAVLALVAAVGAIVYFVTREDDEADAYSRCRVYIGMPTPTPRTPQAFDDAKEQVKFDIVLPQYVPEGVSILDVSPGLGCSEEDADGVSTVYEGAGYRFGISESLVDRLPYETEASGEEVEINDAPGRLFVLDREPHDLLIVAWRNDDLHYVASTYLTDKMTQELFLQILESMPDD